MINISLKKCNNIKGLSTTPETLNLPEDWILLLPWSVIKRKKKWKNKRRLIKKFIKNPRRYIPIDLILIYENYKEKLIRLAYEKGLQQIMEEEDKKFLVDMKGKLKNGD